MLTTGPARQARISMTAPHRRSGRTWSVVLAAALAASALTAATTDVGGTSTPDGPSRPLAEGVTAQGTGSGTALVTVDETIELDDVNVDLDHGGELGTVQLVERTGASGSPRAVAWWNTDADVVCQDAPECDAEFLEGMHSISNRVSDDDFLLEAGDYQLIVVTDPASDFDLSISTSDDTTHDLGTLAAATNVQLARTADRDPSGSDFLWWTGDEREVGPGSVLTQFIAIAGDIRGPGEFNYCVYRGEPRVEPLAYAYPCAEAEAVVGARSVAVEQDHSAVLVGLAGRQAGGIIGQGGHVIGRDVTGHVAAGLWVDPLP